MYFSAATTALLTLGIAMFAPSGATANSAGEARAPMLAIDGLRNGTLAPFSEARYEATLPAGVLSTFIVLGDGSSDLDLLVYDEHGNLVGQDDDTTSYCVVDIVPRWTGKFTVLVRNVGARASSYWLSLE